MAILPMSESPTMIKYRQTMKDCIKLYIPQAPEWELDQAISFSMAKRYEQSETQVVNTYTGKTSRKTLLQIADYINQREPIVTAFGTMFSKHANVRNPLAEVVQEFLDRRSEDKIMMLKFPKGSEEFEYYNLLQQLDKIDCNGIYGILGMYTSMVFNINVATSITSQGRSLISSAIMQFEMFLANNVKFGSLSEVLEFINHIVKEQPSRKYKDEKILDRSISAAECFAKVIISCGYRWIPSEEEMEIIWRSINNLSQENINRVYYKNNLYEFMSNRVMIRAIRYILNKLDEPFMNPLSPPERIIPELDEFVSMLMEYVYYGYQIIDRIDRAEHMIRSVVMISDTDSAIVSLDAWYRFVLNYVKDMNLKFTKSTSNPIFFYEKDEFGDIVDKRYHDNPIQFYEPEYDYDFFDDQLVEMKHAINPIIELPQDHLRHTILNILAYALDKINNDYMERYTKNNHSFSDHRKCKIILKNEFTFRRVLLTAVKKNYASLQETQEGNPVPESKQLDIKGIASMAKSSMSKTTREALKKILLEDILKTDVVDQFIVIKKIAILERKIINSLYDGSREFYKPVTIKALSVYKDPMRIQGIKGAVVWNELTGGDLPAINLEERNAIDVAKVNINPTTVEKIKDDYPEVYERACRVLNEDQFKGQIDSISIPLDIEIPGWLLELIDHNTIVNDNIGGFVYESVGIQRLGKTNLNYTNTLQL